MLFMKIFKSENDYSGRISAKFSSFITIFFTHMFTCLFLFDVT